MGARGVVVGVVGIGVLVGGLLVVDRYAEGEVERAAVAQLAARLDVTGTPTVELGGFPFLTQLLAGSVDEVVAHADGVVLEGTDLVDVDATATGVTTSEPYTAARVRFTGTVPTASLEQLVRDHSEVDADLATDGAELVASGAVLGLELSARLAPSVVEGALQVGVTTVSVGGVSVEVADLPGRLEDRLSGIPVPLDGLPEGVVLSEVQVVPEGARIVAVGQDVALQAP